MKFEGFWSSAWRFVLLASFGGVYFALATVILRPSATQARSESFHFPAQLPLSGWQLVNTNSIVGPSVRQQGQQYQYVQNGRSMTAQLWYGRDGRACQRLLQQPASSDLSTLGAQVSANQASDATSNSAEAQNVSAYTPSIHETVDGSYKYISQIGADSIQAVVDSRGGSVVTREQFIRNRYQYFLRPQPMLRWLTGKESITGDHDCLLIELSTPTESTSAASTHSLLKSTWQELSQWGQAQLYAKR